VLGSALAFVLAAIAVVTFPAIYDFVFWNENGLPRWVGRFWKASFVLGPVTICIIWYALRSIRRAEGSLRGRALADLGLIAALIPPAYIALLIMTGAAGQSM
jgi:hypothetical protein